MADLPGPGGNPFQVQQRPGLQYRARAVRLNRLQIRRGQYRAEFDGRNRLFAQLFKREITGTRHQPHRRFRLSEIQQYDAVEKDGAAIKAKVFRMSPLVVDGQRRRRKRLGMSQLLRTAQPEEILYGPDRKSGVKGKRVSGRVDLGGRGHVKKKKQTIEQE